MPTIRVKVADRWFTVEVPDPHASPVTAIVDGEEIEVRLEDVVVEEVQPESIAPPPPPDTRQRLRPILRPLWARARLRPRSSPRRCRA